MLRVLLPLVIGFSMPCEAEGLRSLVFCSYNLENYSDARPPSHASPGGVKAKPEKEIQALVEIVKAISPDVLGVCEIGSAERLTDFQQRLAGAGVKLPNAEFVKAVDDDRHLALLSRFPIASRQSRADIPFVVNGRLERVRRGVLDVTLQVTAGYRLRCVGVHLKSKLPIPDGEAIVRRMEAQKVREHLDAIFAEEPLANVICYGDFNDTKDQPMFQAVTGPAGSRGHMSDLPCRDSVGDRWTYHWKPADQYSRIDYLFVSPGLWPEVDRSSAAVYRADNWNVASDHRPIYTAIRPVERPRR